MDEATYRLFQFFGCYLNPDWPEDFGTWENAVRSFVNVASESQRFEVAADIDRMSIALTDDEKLCERLYNELCCHYDPCPELGGPTVREWLGQVAEFLRHPD